MDLQSVDTCNLALHKVMFSLAVYDVFTLNPLDVGCVRIDSLVLDA